MNKMLILLLALSLAACKRGPEAAAEHGHDEQQGHAESAAAKGPHGGRLLADGDFQLEITIFEDGLPPEFHVYARHGGKPLAPSAVELSVTLTRLDGETNAFRFVPERDYLKGQGPVTEPHSFDVRVEAVHQGRKHAWTYSTHEGRTRIGAGMARSMGIETAVAGPGVLRERLPLYGSIRPNAERVRAVAARFPGVIRSVSGRLGDTVKAGQVLATVESNESLQTYAITAPIAGTITQRAANPGEAAGSEPLFVIADYASVWAELSVFPRDRARLQAGQPVKITAADAQQAGGGVINAIAASADGPTLVTRVTLDNTRGQWSPGQFVTAEVVIGEAPVGLAVPNAALQGFRDFTVVFAQVGEDYEVRMLELGRSDGEMTEVLGGLKPGTRYVSANSYLVKADIEKSGASHDH
ncbi:efflux RND transporter periplasmic adaptor subunit [Solimonas sp. SE-A11]|uniref:efflux RND transporter periplasmic adaptor subunit n=1 Tax=Solimonas sp. SE-A11 TaxID=3054954 RepID=UPI00259D013E|nr:efflux RND transporter periplasmic adaptor subunit [Solimonas sp. SE-A11]MDM4772081.1 efflux RND transporter periplasmic adaptor subunit [Solimonas sp. SE-A11]